MLFLTPGLDLFLEGAELGASSSAWDPPFWAQLIPPVFQGSAPLLSDRVKPALESTPYPPPVQRHGLGGNLHQALFPAACPTHSGSAGKVHPASCPFPSNCSHKRGHPCRVRARVPQTGGSRAAAAYSPWGRWTLPGARPPAPQPGVGLVPSLSLFDSASPSRFLVSCSQPHPRSRCLCSRSSPWSSPGRV